MMTLNCKYKIRSSSKSDIADMLKLAVAARGIMRKSGNLSQWPDDYPNIDVFSSDIVRQGSFLMLDDKDEAVGTFAFLPGPEPTYSKIYNGEWINVDMDYYVIHRIASIPASHGIFQSMLSYCFKRTNNIRIDTHRDNIIMQHLLEKNGFKYCGIIYLANGDERLAYQLFKDE